MDLLKDQTITREFAAAWADSRSSHPSHRHEEGGYIVQNPDGTRAVIRWPQGEQFRIAPPPLDENNWYNKQVVIAAFHTHPNPSIDELGRQWQQEPSSADRRWHERWKLPGFVISRDFVYAIDADGSYRITGRRDEVLVP